VCVCVCVSVINPGQSGILSRGHFDVTRPHERVMRGGRAESEAMKKNRAVRIAL
jgi:hypothetical protein